MGKFKPEEKVIKDILEGHPVARDFFRPGEMGEEITISPGTK